MSPLDRSVSGRISSLLRPDLVKQALYASQTSLSWTGSIQLFKQSTSATSDQSKSGLISEFLKISTSHAGSVSTSDQSKSGRVSAGSQAT